ncbi:MAG: hypothetical protein V3V16_12340 [Melioribacteraceae bacterium]
MSESVSEKTKQKIRKLFKELISVYKTKKYKEEIISVESNQKKLPTFQLRFFKQGEKSIYYRILLNKKEPN